MKQPISPSSVGVTNIQALPDIVIGDASNLKATFDKTGLDEKTYINTVLIPELNGNDGSKKIGHDSLNITSDNVGDALEELSTTTVKLTGNQTVNDIKTFSSSPIVPTPTTDMQASTKKYVDDVASDIVVGVIPDNSITDIKLSSTPGQIKSQVQANTTGIENINLALPSKADVTQLDDYVLLTDYEDLDVLNKIKNVDGTGNGLDADLVRGEVAFAQSNYGKVNADTANRTLSLADLNTVLIYGTTAARTITIPTNAVVEFPIGTAITVVRDNTGSVTFAPSSGVTLLSKDTKRAIDGRYASATVVKTATDTWYLFGALA